MNDKWLFDAEPPSTEPGIVTLIEQTSFCVGSRNGNLDPASPHGLFFEDTRILSRWTLTIDGSKVEPLAVTTPEPFTASFVGRARMKLAPGSTLLVERTRYVGTGMREDVVVRNLTGDAVDTDVELAVAADFADLFQVKESRTTPPEGIERSVIPDGLIVTQWLPGVQRGVRVAARADDDSSPTVSRDGTITFHPKIAAHATWTATFDVVVSIGADELSPTFPGDHPVADTPPAQRARKWREQAPVVTSPDQALLRTLDTSRRDLGALRIFDPAEPSIAAVAAGAPWFMALFGRDSLLTSLMALPLDPTLALGTLRTLARYQGTREDPVTEEEPGRILHEVRLGSDARLTLGGGAVYYGTADATPLFVMLLGELRRWGLGEQHLAELLPAADRALEWIRRHGDRSGNGFVAYRRATDRGLYHQGWKDSHDGVTFADGRIPDAPIALCEVQAYTFAAYVARSHLAREQGDIAGQQHWAQAADDLRERFNRRFWLEDRGWYAVALDRDGTPVDSLTSNIGHCLWTGIADPDKAAVVAQKLMSDEMFTGWGVRTLASSMQRYNPMSYHNGSVWPHDNAIVASGLMRYGFVDEATRIATGLFDAAEWFDGRLPELFCGFDRREFDQPIPFPTSCSPQAWAAAAPLHLLRTLLRLHPAVSQGTIALDPVVPARMLPLTLDGVAVGNATLHIDVQICAARIAGLTPELTWSNASDP